MRVIVVLVVIGFACLAVLWAGGSNDRAPSGDKLVEDLKAGRLGWVTMFGGLADRLGPKFQSADWDKPIPLEPGRPREIPVKSGKPRAAKFVLSSGSSARISYACARQSGQGCFQTLCVVSQDKPKPSGPCGRVLCFVSERQARPEGCEDVIDPRKDTGKLVVSEGTLKLEAFAPGVLEPR